MDMQSSPVKQDHQDAVFNMERKTKVWGDLWDCGLTIRDNWIIYFDTVCVFDVDPISIGTQDRSRYVNGFDMDILAAIESKVELGTILNFKSLHSQVGAHEKPYSLHHEF